MVKMLTVIGRRAGSTHETFIGHWTTAHLEVYDRVPEIRDRVRRYMQNHLFVERSDMAAFDGSPIRADADGIVEVWFDDVDAIKQAFQEPRYFEIIKPDEQAFGDLEGAWGALTDEFSIMEKAGFSGHIKLFAFLKRKAGLTQAQFLATWGQLRDQKLSAGNAFRQHVGRFVDNRVRQDPADTLPGMDRYDTVVELWFDSLASASAFTSDAEVSRHFWNADVLSPADTRAYVAEDYPAAAEWLRVGTTGKGKAK